MQKLTQFTPQIFRQLESHLIQTKNDSDKSTFTELKEILNNPKKLNSTEFAEEIIYVILASGFKQKTAKKYFYLIIKNLKNTQTLSLENLLKIFNNKNKIKAIIQIWQNKKDYCKKFYSLKNINEKINFLSKLPHIGNITKYHIARNLGLDFVKYDIWIQRLGVCLYGHKEDICKINNAKLCKNVRQACDKMFENLSTSLNEKQGYIDVVLWKACQQKILIIDNKNLFLNL